MRADANGNLWVQTIRFTQERGSFVYDVIDRLGALVDRVQVPSGASIVGFAPGGSVLLARRDGNESVLLEHVTKCVWGIVDWHGAAPSATRRGTVADNRVSRVSIQSLQRHVS